MSGLLELDRRRRAMMQEAEALKARRNEVSAQIPRMKGEGRDVSDLMAQMKETAARIKEYDARLSAIDGELDNMLLSIPICRMRAFRKGRRWDNLELRRVLTPREFDLSQSRIGI